MKTNRLLLLLTAPALVVPFASGCMFQHAPEPAPVPAVVPTPTRPFFDPTAGQVQPKATPISAVGSIGTPDNYHLISPVSGDTVVIHSMSRKVQGGPLLPGSPDTVKLAGIVAPTEGPGLAGAIAAISGWTKDESMPPKNQDLEVEQDGVYPLTLDGKKVVQIYFKGHGTRKDTRLSLNRMLVRSGWAVVDLYSPTSFDTSQWLLDEAHARLNLLGFWKYGVAIQQRVPADPKKKANASKVVIQPNAVPGSVPAPGATAPGAAGGTSGPALTAPGGVTLPTQPGAASAAPTTPGASAAPTTPGASAAPTSSG